MKFPHAKSVRAAFTLLELLVATAVFLLIIGVVMQFVNQTSKVWRDSNSRIQAFQEARAGFDAMTRMLSQATLNTYLDYYDSSNKARAQLTSEAELKAFVPEQYSRFSDLHFVSGQATALLPSTVATQTHAIFFQAPRGYSVEEDFEALDNALNATGFFLKFDDGASALPGFIRQDEDYPKRYRFRLMEMIQATEELSVYFDPADGTPPGKNDWFLNHADSNSRIIAENVIAMVLLPRLPDRLDDPSKGGGGVSLAPNYNYNSRIPLGADVDADFPGATPEFPGDEFTAYPATGASTTVTRHHQLPPIVKVLMVVIDEASAIRLQGTSTTIPSAIDFSGTTLFQDATKLAEDVQAVEDICNAVSGNLTSNKVPLNYRVFTSDIILNQAKWSNN